MGSSTVPHPSFHIFSTHRSVYDLRFLPCFFFELKRYAAVPYSALQARYRDQISKGILQPVRHVGWFAYFLSPLHRQHVRISTTVQDNFAPVVSVAPVCLIRGVELVLRYHQGPQIPSYQSLNKALVSHCILLRPYRQLSCCRLQLSSKLLSASSQIELFLKKADSSSSSPVTSTLWIRALSLLAVLSGAAVLKLLSPTCAAVS